MVIIFMGGWLNQVIYSKRSSENRNRDFRRLFDKTGGLFVFCFFKADDFQAEAGQAGEGGGLS